MKEMSIGDLVFFYHSGKEKAIVGLATVSEGAFEDPADPDFVAVKIKAKQPFKNPVSLSKIKSSDQLSDLLLIKQSRLSVMPVSPSEAAILLKMSL